MEGRACEGAKGQLVLKREGPTSAPSPTHVKSLDDQRTYSGVQTSSCCTLKVLSSSSSCFQISCLADFLSLASSPSRSCGGEKSRLVERALGEARGSCEELVGLVAVPARRVRESDSPGARRGGSDGGARRGRRRWRTKRVPAGPRDRRPIHGVTVSFASDCTSFKAATLTHHPQLNLDPCACLRMASNR